MPKEFTSLADRAYELLEQKIISLQLKPGQVYSETELSELIELGRTPMREALLRLAKERMVQMIPRRGVLISDIDLKQHIGLLETRKALDTLIVMRAAGRVSRQQRDRLKECSAEMMRAAEDKDVSAFRRIDDEVDLVLGAASKSVFAVDAVKHLYAHCKRFWSYYHDHLDLAHSARQHSKLLLAVAGGDEEGARNAVVDIIDGQIAFTRKALDL
jgi:DNA-binding GntR family transcriptional regulator